MFRSMSATAATAAAVLVLGGLAVTGPARASDVAPSEDCQDSFSFLLEETSADVDLAGFAAVSGDLEPLLAEYYERRTPFGQQLDRLYYGALAAGVDEFEDFEDGVAREIAEEQAGVQEAETDLATQQAELADAQADLEDAETAGDDEAAAAAQARIAAAETAITDLELVIADTTEEIEFLRGVPDGLAEAQAQLDAIGAELLPRLDALIGTDGNDWDVIAFNATREVLADCSDEIDALLAGAQDGDDEDDSDDEDDEDDERDVAPVAKPVPARATFTG